MLQTRVSSKIERILSKIDYLEAQDICSDGYSYKQLQFDLEDLFDQIDMSCRIEKFKKRKFVFDIQKQMFH